tara:strand:- start:48 stop:2114 length:2067 start_codon:yes stop_codon:yes gene_type:complete
MNLKLDRLIEKKQFNLFIIISFFLIFISFVLSKGFFKNEELSDKIFLVSCIISIETIYLVCSNKIINFSIKNSVNYLILFTFFIFIFTIWNVESAFSYIDISLFFIFHLLLIIPLMIFLDTKNIKDFNKYRFDNYLLLAILSLIFSGLFYQLNYSSFESFLIILILSLIILILNFLLKNCYKWVDYSLSLIVFLILIKVFLLSSEKDSFHYSWVLGPVNSLQNNYNLLDNVVSQYGYLNILIISKLTQFTNFESSNVLVSFIIGLFIIFYSVFLSKISELVKLPMTVLTIFLSFLIYGNIGHFDLSGSMFIPSSSVFRFFPSLITVIFFSKILNHNDHDDLKKVIPFYLSLFVSLTWSFESAFFTTFSLGSFFLLKLIFNFNYLPKNRFDFFSILSEFKFSITLGILLLLISYFLFNDRNISLFYEHALNTRGSLAKEIINNKITMFFLFLLFLCYLILRDSFVNKKLFFYNTLWFALFVSYSAYFLVRSVDSNIFNILPFIFFIICAMKVNSIHIKILRNISLYTIIFFSIISSIFTVINSKEKFLDNLLTSKILVAPKYLDKKYLPHSKILNSINQYKNTPLTLISGKTLHDPNPNLPSYGYGLPILPLENFNILKLNKKQNLMDNFFDQSNNHLLLCINECFFYHSNNENNINSKIFLGKNIEFKKIIEIKTNSLNEILYLLSKV